MTALKILCVEDDEDTSEMLTILLGVSGYDVTVTPSVSEALKLAQGSDFDLYILDDTLPDGSGIELCRRIRSLDRNTAILVYSIDDEIRSEVLAAGAQEFLLKSGDIADIERAVARLTGKNR